MIAPQVREGILHTRTNDISIKRKKLRWRRHSESPQKTQPAKSLLRKRNNVITTIKVTRRRNTKSCKDRRRFESSVSVYFKDIIIVWRGLCQVARRKNWVYDPMFDARQTMVKSNNEWTISLSQAWVNPALCFCESCWKVLFNFGRVWMCFFHTIQNGLILIHGCQDFNTFSRISKCLWLDLNSLLTKQITEDGWWPFWKRVASMDDLEIKLLLFQIKDFVWKGFLGGNYARTHPPTVVLVFSLLPHYRESVCKCLVCVL